MRKISRYGILAVFLILILIPTAFAFSLLDIRILGFSVRDFFVQDDFQIGIQDLSCTATGGTITTVGSYKIHTFTSNGSFNVTTGCNVEVLVVAGGGGGGGVIGGGGGAGGLIYNSSLAVTSQNYTIIVGSGGTGGTTGYGNDHNFAHRGQNGGNSSAFSLIAIGGGGGNTYSSDSLSPGFDGGCGGGPGRGDTAGTSAGGTGFQGYNGGNSTQQARSVAGGGGGMGSAGGVPTSTLSGNGGNGTNYSISGSNLYYAGGGGGGAWNGGGQGSNIAGNGTHGGGDGKVNTGEDGTAGATNTGSGGGGGAYTDGASGGKGGAGGSGIVIIRYLKSNDIVSPSINFASPTPANNAKSSTKEAIINVSISDDSLNEFKWNWNGTNSTLYNDSLVLMMNFENFSSLGESDSKVVDLSKYSNNGTVTNALWNSSGKFRGAYNFDGNGDYLSTTMTGFPSGGSPRTISLWVYPRSYNKYPISYGAFSAGNEFGLLVQDSTISIDIYGGWSNFTVMPLNQWSFVAFGIYDSTHPFLYYNGVNLSLTGIGTVNTILTNSRIGCRSNSGDFFNGMVDEVMIWNRSLSTNEIQQLYKSNLQKFNQTQWYFYSNQSNLSYTTYTYSASAKDSSDNFNQTETRNLIIQADVDNPLIEFKSPTPASGTSTSNTSVQINVSISEANLDEFKWNWNSTNYTFYNDSLVLMMSFDNLSSLGENSTKVVDNSKYSNNGTVINGAIWNSSGKYGGTYNFDGADDYAEISDKLYFSPANNSISYEFWIKTTQTGAAKGIMGKGAGENFEYDIEINRVSNKLSYWTWNLAGAQYNVQVDSVKSINDGNWHHVVVTHDNSITTAKIYIDGAFDSQDTTSNGGTMGDGNATFLIGKTWVGYFNGTLDEVKIYNRILPADEVKQHYYSTLQKFNQTQWYFYSNQSNLSLGAYTYSASAKDTSGNENQTETRTLEIISDIPLANLARWYKADAVTGISNGSAVSTWTDSSPQHQDATGGAASYITNSINGLPALKFNGNTMYSFTRLTNAREIYWVLVDVENCDVSGYSPPLIGDSANYDYHKGSNDAGDISCTLWSSIYASNYVKSGQTKVNGANVNGSLTFLTKNAWTMVSVNTTGNTAVSQITRDRSFTQMDWNGSIAEIIIYNATNNDTARRSIEAYLMNKYGIEWADTTPPLINFTSPTPANGTSTSNTSVSINVSISESNLNELKFNWNGTNYTVYNDSLVLMMNFNNLSSLGENATKAVDISKSSINGTVFGALWASSGIYKGVYNFDGTNDWINLSNSPINQTDNFTFSAWFKPDLGGSSNEGMMVASIGDVNAGYALGFHVTNGYIGGVFPGVVWQQATPYTLATAGQWYHLVLRRTSGITTFWINGENYTASNPSAPLAPTSGKGAIGQLIDGTSIGTHYFNGSVDEVILWNRSLSDAEIKQQYYSTLQKFNSTQWYFYSNQSNLSVGTYTYSASAKDAAGNENQTELRTLSITQVPNNPPTQSTPKLNSTLGTNLSTENITCYPQNLSDLDGNAVYPVFNWKKNNVPVAVLNLPFDLNVSSTAAGAVKDYSGFGNNGRLGNALATTGYTPVWTSSGKFGGAYQFNGLNSSIVVDYSNSLNILTNITVEAWVKPLPNSDEYQAFVSNADNTNGWIFRMTPTAPNNAMQVFSWNPGVSVDSGALTWTSGQWYHVAFTFSNPNLTIYRNGAAVASGTRSSDFAASSAKIAIGRGYASSGTHFFNGTIDDVKIWNRTLSQQELYQHFIEGNRSLNTSAIVSQELKTGDNWTCQVTANDLINDSQTLDSNNMTILAPDTTPPLINFTSPTPANGTSTSNTSVQINISISESSLGEFKFNWNSTNYTFYNDSLILMYNLDNNSALGETASLAVDNSKASNNGTLMNSAFWNSSGKYGGAFQLASVNDYLQTKTIGGGLNGLNETTISFWVNFNGWSGIHNQIFVDNVGPSGNVRNINFNFIDTSPNNIYLNMVDTSGTTSMGVADGTVPINSLNTWYHVTVTWKRHGTMNIYFNGVLNKTATVTTDAPLNNAEGNLTFGKHPQNTIQTLIGRFDEIRVYNRQFSASEVKQLYQSNLQKYNQTQWYFYSNQSNLSYTTYTYSASAKDSLGNENQTELRTLSITAGDTCTPPVQNQDWNANFADNCTAYQQTTINLGTGRLVLSGTSGTFTLTQNMTAHGLVLSPGSGKLIQMPGARITLV